MSTSDLTDETLAEWERDTNRVRRSSFPPNIWVSRVLALIAEVRRLQEIGDHTSCVEAYSALMAKVEAAEAEPSDPERPRSNFTGGHMSSTTTPRAGYLSLGQASAYVGVHERTLRNRVAEGRLTAYRMSGSRMLRFRREDLDALMSPVPTTGNMS